MIGDLGQVLVETFLFGRDEVEFLFDVYSGFFGLIFSYFILWYRVAIGLDMGGDDVTMRVAGVVMAIDQVRLSFEAELFHVRAGDGLHFFVGELVRGVEIQADVLAGGHSFVELLSSFEAEHFIFPGELVHVLQEVFGQDAFGLVEGYFLLVV